MTRFGSVLTGAVLAAATMVLPGVTVAPAAAATCSDASGITVVVDRGVLGGSPSQTCVAGGGKDAATLFAEAGHELERVQSFPGAVCRVDGAPANANCGRMPPTNEYWGLFWSDGKSGSWVYSSSGVDNLDVPAGGSVAFAWQSSNTRRNPTVKPPDHDGSGADDPGGSGGGSGGTGGSGGGGRTGGASGGATGDPTGGASSDAPASSPPSASDSPTSDSPKPADSKQGKRDRPAKDGQSDRPREQQTETAVPTEEPTMSPDAVPADDVATTPVAQGGLPLWLVGLAGAGLLAVGTTVAVVRRRATHDA
jgi:hypothetical protein